MRRIPRIPQSLDLFLEPAIFPRSTTSICLSCRRRTALLQPRSFATTASRNAGEQPGLTDKLRRELWGTDKPPGAADPYSPGSPLRAETTELDEQGQADAAAESTSTDAANAYEQATTWEGLEWVGTKEWEEQQVMEPKRPFRT